LERRTARRATRRRPRGRSARRRFGVDGDLVLLLEAADAGDLGDAGHALEGVAEREVLERAQLAEVVAPAAVDEGVLVDPADAGGVGADAG
jgi:hypothetical protein